MTIYEETIAALKDPRTLASHITNLGKLMNKTEDPQLKTLLERVISSLQTAHANPKTFGRSTPRSLYKEASDRVKSVIQYCERLIVAQKPEWQLLAERHGWGPKT
ncbi:MAG: hypothetical protein ACN6OP_24155 [Pseudomonadales bacterium]